MKVLKRGLRIIWLLLVLFICIKVNYSSVEAAQVKYQKPNKIFKEENVYVKVTGVDREYKIAWISDLHIITDLVTATDISADKLDIIKTRFNLMFKTSDGMHAYELWPEIVNYLNYNNFDAIIFGGDMLDYNSQKNLLYFISYYNKLNPNVPVMFLRADHDYGEWYSGGTLTYAASQRMHSSYVADGNLTESKKIDFNKFVILGINNSTSNMTDSYYSWFEEQYNEARNNGKKVIIATHVPLYSKVDTSLEQLSLKTLNSICYWSPNSEIYKINGTTQKFLDKVYASDTSVIEVLAGHLHPSWDGKITNQVSEHLFEAAFNGSIGIIHVVP